jgi:aminoglycoside/choline kinase family phosphotransferase
MILIKYTPQRPENLRYVDIATFLSESGVPVPRIHLHDREEGLIWMQDLGADDLWQLASAGSPSERLKGYQSALESVIQLHGPATEAFRQNPLALEIEFNEQLYLWEQGYFFEHCLSGIFGLNAEQVSRVAGLPALTELAAALANQERVLIHRDFQSQNVMLQGGRAWLIDFQGMRPGLAQYDLASLLYDPYVDLTAAERETLLGFYKRLVVERGGSIPDDFDLIFAGCAVQRLMQALGAYGFLGLKCGKPEFLAHVPAAKRSLREVAARIDGMDEFVSLLECLP